MRLSSWVYRQSSCSGNVVILCSVHHRQAGKLSHHGRNELPMSAHWWPNWQLAGWQLHPVRRSRAAATRLPAHCVQVTYQNTTPPAAPQNTRRPKTAKHCGSTIDPIDPRMSASLRMLARMPRCLVHLLAESHDPARGNHTRCFQARRIAAQPSMAMGPQTCLAKVSGGRV